MQPNSCSTHIAATAPMPTAAISYKRLRGSATRTHTSACFASTSTAATLIATGCRTSNWHDVPFAHNDRLTMASCRRGSYGAGTFVFERTVDDATHGATAIDLASCAVAIDFATGGGKSASCKGRIAIAVDDETRGSNTVTAAALAPRGPLSEPRRTLSRSLVSLSNSAASQRGSGLPQQSWQRRAIYRWAVTWA